MPTIQSGRCATVSATVTLACLFLVSSHCSTAIAAPAENELVNDIRGSEHFLKSREHVKVKPRDWVTGKVTIKAPVSTVWYSVHEERKKDPDLAYSKVLEQSEHEVTLEQKFVLLPMLGTSVCVMKDTEIPQQRIDYHLLKSDHFKALEGSWVLTPSADGKSTVLELSSHIDLGIPVPRCFVNGALSKKIERRLDHVKTMAEKMHGGVVAEKGMLR